MRRSFHNRWGFTVVELMVSAFIMALVLGGLCTFMVTSHRLVKGAYAEAELSIQLRTLREKLLFHVAPPHGGNVWAGLLSGSSINNAPVVENSMKVRMSANGISLTDGKACPQTIELLVRTETTQDGTVNRWFGNDGDRYDDQWQRPYLRQVSNYLQTGWLEDSEIGRNLLFITLNATMNGYSRNERLAVPVFGKQQQRSAAGVFHGR